MKIRKILTESKTLLSSLINLRAEIAAAAQSVYDDWIEEQEAGGGICDDIASVISSILSHYDINNTSGGHDGDDHAYTIAFNDAEAFIVDIPYDTYEIGGGYNWTKINGVKFSPDDVVIEKTQRPDWADDDLNEY